jgi:regulator of protease activity HflC (stomatin/prohibitin superfamily)
MSLAAVTLVLWACAALALVVRAAHMIGQEQHGVIERNGRYHAMVGQGLHFVVPFIDTVTRVQGGRRTLAVEGRVYLCREIALVRIEGTLTFDVVNPMRARYGVADLEHALTSTAQAFTSDALATLPARYQPSDAAYVAAHVQRRFDEFVEAWGVRVVRFEPGGAGTRALEAGSGGDVVSVGGAATSVAISSD